MNVYRLSLSLVILMLEGSNTWAQSSVTLYGTLDDAVAYYNNVGGHSVIQIQGGGQEDNKWGLKGGEDLGGGMKAVFALENGFVINNGTLDQDGREFGRQAYVGLSSEAFGTLTLGRQDDPIVDLVQPITADGYGAAFSTPGDADNNDNSLWVNNAVKYLSPSYAGFQYELLYGFGGVPGSTTSGQTYSAAVSFTNGGFSAAGGYFFAKNDRGAAGSSDPIADNSVTPLSGATAFVGSRQIVQAGVQYVLGDFTANARYSNAQFKPYLNFGAFNRTETFNIGATSLGWQATPALLLAVGYTYTRSSGNASATYNSGAATAQYGLSKRTNFYATVGYTHASGTSFSTDGSTLVPAGGAVSDLAPTSGTPTQVAVMLGIAHKF
ncbi:Outer membrane protein (porin) [Burkholderia sp. D7]|nr:Outer membrane protein (porin) [Burkholderia sp. D7]